MTKTYEQIVKQIESLKQEAERARSREIAGVVSRIRDAISAYNLTADDLGLGGAAASAFAKSKPGPKPGFKKAGKPGPKPGGKRRGPKPGFKAAAAAALAAATGAAPAAAAPQKRRGPKPKGNKAKKPMVVKFRNDSGGTWGGMGKRPDWLRAALAGGKQLSDFAVK